jgi:bacterioferritin-associated ferredoxin
MISELASDEVTDAIAFIEVHRQEAAKETSLGQACAEALRKLHELLEQERATSQPADPKGGNSVNVEAILQEIKKVKGLAGNSHHDQGPRPPRNNSNARPAQQQRPAPHGQPRNKGRRSMGRSSNGR